jgi:RHS repeat-associated protein
MTYYKPESDLFLTPARSYGTRLGRGMSPDPLGGDVTNPQSLNRYAYVLNNPTTLTDPLGLQECPSGAHQIGQGQCEDSYAGGELGYFLQELSGDLSPYDTETLATTLALT